MKTQEHAVLLKELKRFVDSVQETGRGDGPVQRYVDELRIILERYMRKTGFMPSGGKSGEKRKNEPDDAPGGPR